MAKIKGKNHPEETPQETNVDLPMPKPGIEEIPSQEPLTQTEQENAVLAEAEKGIEQALTQEVESIPVVETPPSLFEIGNTVVIGKEKAIILSYEKFVRYAYGLVTNNPANASAYFGFAGKSKLMDLLGITDPALKEKVWVELRETYAKRK